MFLVLVLVTGWRQDGSPRRLVRGWAVVSLAFAALLPDLGFSWYLLVPIAVIAMAASAPLLAAMTVVGVAPFGMDLWRTDGLGPFPRGVLLVAGVVVALALGTALLAFARWRPEAGRGRWARRDRELGSVSR